MRIAIVNDTAIAIEALRRVLLTVSGYEVAWIARDGAEAVARCVKDTPDLILMDLVMPIMDGVEATRQIMSNTPCLILIVTASVGQNAGKVFEAMGHGALDAADLPVLGTQENAHSSQALLNKIATLSKLIGKTPYRSTPVPETTFNKLSTSKLKTPFGSTQREQNSPLKIQNSTLNTQSSTLIPSLDRPQPNSLTPLIAIGSSTGGPKALAAILSLLPSDFGAAIAIVQHVDQQFSAGLVDWLNQQTPLTVKLAKAGDRLTKSTVLVAGTNDHLSLRADHTLHYIKEPADYPYRPSVDVFFKSLAQHWSRKDIAVLLTGMGQDGAEGLSLLRSQGWHTITQDKASCAVYGMPKAAVALNAAVEILPPEKIATTLIQRLKLRSSKVL